MFSQLSILWETGHCPGAPHGDVQHGPLPGVGRRQHQHLRHSIRLLKLVTFVRATIRRNTEFIRSYHRTHFAIFLISTRRGIISTGSTPPISLCDRLIANNLRGIEENVNANGVEIEANPLMTRSALLTFSFTKSPMRAKHKGIKVNTLCGKRLQLWLWQPLPSCTLYHWVCLYGLTDLKSRMAFIRET